MIFPLVFFARVAEPGRLFRTVKPTSHGSAFVSQPRESEMHPVGRIRVAGAYSIDCFVGLCPYEYISRNDT